MWTPKRIVMLSVCFAAFITFYLGYAFTSLGRIDGLPPLPEIYWPRIDDLGTLPTPIHKPKSTRDQMIEMAFGKNCPELDRPIRLALPKHNMVVAAEEFYPDKGRICLKPISVAMFKDMGKDRTDGPCDITTLRHDVAWIRFDRPVTNFSEIGSRKIVEAELNGEITVVNNRRRGERDQDLHLLVPKGPLYYREETHKIWTHDVVKLTDHRGKPHPHTLSGKGMEMELLTEPPPAKPGVRKGQREAISGVKWVELQSSVTIKIFLDGRNSFLAGDQAKKPPSDKPAAPAELTITTPGKFRYDINKDHDLARFDALAVETSQTAKQPPQVLVDRFNVTEKKHDQLVCQHLTLRLKRKDDAEQRKTKPAARAGEGADIETAHAVSSGKGRYVLLTSDSDGLIAEGHDFFHDAVKQRSILKATTGMVVVTYKDDTKIHARELEIQDVKPPPPPGWKPGTELPVSARPYQTIKGKGPGWVHLVDKSEKEKRSIKAEWTELLTSDRDGSQDVLTLTGNARFIDELAHQSLKADLLKVWFDPPEVAKSQPAKDRGGSRKPRHLEAMGNVFAWSKEINIHDTNRLLVRFVDVPAQKHLPPGVTPEEARPVDKRPVAQPAPKSAEPVPPKVPQAMPPGPAPVPGQPVSRPLAGPLLGAPPKDGDQRPFDLSARLVEAKVERSPIKNTLDELWCEGQVKVKQEPVKGEDKKGTDISGDKLKMTAGPDGGYHLIVMGDLAELSTDRIYICGPEVNIDQSSNKAWVIGDGAMQMESATNFQGEKLPKPVPMTVHWEKSMLFNGTTADFTGNIQATQQDARLASQHLLVTFDRMISLRQGNRGDQPARVKKLVCDQEVRVEEITRDPKDERRVVKYQSLHAPVLHMDALEPDDERPGTNSKMSNKVIAPGPGSLRVWEPATADVVPGIGPEKNKTKSAKPTTPEMKMTYVAFRGQMQGNSQTNTANFWDKVQVLNLPWPRHDQPLNLEEILLRALPQGALYLRCDRLKVLDRPTEGKPNKQMEGHGNVYAQGREFYAHAASVYFNQQKQQVILVGSEDAPTTLYREYGPGGMPETVSGKKIIYNRGTGQIHVEGANQIQGQTTPGRR